MSLFNIDNLTADVFAELAVLITRDPNGISGQGRRAETDDELWAARGVVADNRARRSGRTDEELRQVAKIYRDHFDNAPAEAVETVLGYTERTARRRISEARERGFLPKTTKGKKAK